MESQPQILNSGLILKTFTHVVRIANREDPDQTASSEAV